MVDWPMLGQSAEDDKVMRDGMRRYNTVFGKPIVGF
jgi:hypothetical protein